MSDADATDEKRPAIGSQSSTDHDGYADESDGQSRRSDGASYEHDVATANAGETDDDSLTGVHPTAVDREFGQRGWILVGVIVLAFVVAPIGVMLVPPGGEGYLFALVLVPLIPAVVLAATAVWATTRP